MTDSFKKKLIEVSLPLETINRESAREKSIRHGHPSTLHLWWARRPLAACRAVLFAQLVDDPSSNPEMFTTVESQDIERERLFGIIEKLVDWDNIENDELFKLANAEIRKSLGDAQITVMDPFAGGGSIPLEAQRLGLQAIASDLNPVSVLINKALLEVPQLFLDLPPVHTEFSQAISTKWDSTLGLSKDILAYGKDLLDLAHKSIGDSYAKDVSNQGQLQPIVAWIWARTVTCPNPACQIPMPLVRSFCLARKPGKNVWVTYKVKNGKINFDVTEAGIGPKTEGTIGRTGAICVACNDAVSLKYIREEGKQGRLGQQLMSVVTKGARSRNYIAPTEIMEAEYATFSRSEGFHEVAMPVNPRDFKTPNYGLKNFVDLFNNRQLTALETLASLVPKVAQTAQNDALKSGRPAHEATAYGNAIAIYLSFAISRCTDYNNTICTWGNSRESIRNMFSKQAIPMTWDYAEANVLGDSTGSLSGQVTWIAEVIRRLTPGIPATVEQADATIRDYPKNIIVSTDPPYYDNIAYADLSDFFYVWLRQALGHIYPEITATMQTPKASELVAFPYRFGGDKNAANEHFEAGFLDTFSKIRKHHNSDVPITIFYAFKQTETDESGLHASTGWETMLSGLLASGLTITATWPIRTEMEARLIGSGANALASSIVLACRTRSTSAQATDRRGFLKHLHDELPGALKELQKASIAPVDLAQASIGPGMGIFSRYTRVLEADGSDMSIRTALALINQVLYEILAEQEGDFDADTRFCLKWFEQCEWNEGSYGTAETLATAMATAVDSVARGGILKSGGGKVQLVHPDFMPALWDPLLDDRISEWEVLMHLAQRLLTQGESSAADLLNKAKSRINIDAVKELSYQLYGICEKKNWSKSGQIFNSLGASWNDLNSKAQRIDTSESITQTLFNFNEDEA